MKLIKYMKEFKLRQHVLARILNINQGAVSHKILNKRKWTPTEAFIIERYTKGMVSRMEILYPNEK